jgi:hypothetical protein
MKSALKIGLTLLLVLLSMAAVDCRDSVFGESNSIAQTEDQAQPVFAVLNQTAMNANNLTAVEVENLTTEESKIFVNGDGSSTDVKIKNSRFANTLFVVGANASAGSIMPAANTETAAPVNSTMHFVYSGKVELETTEKVIGGYEVNNLFPENYIQALDNSSVVTHKGEYEVKNSFPEGYIGALVNSSTVTHQGGYEVKNSLPKGYVEALENSSNVRYTGEIKGEIFNNYPKDYVSALENSSTITHFGQINMVAQGSFGVNTTQSRPGGVRVGAEVFTPRM